MMLPAVSALCLGIMGAGAIAEFVTLEDAWRIGLRDSFTMASARDAVRAADINALQAAPGVIALGFAISVLTGVAAGGYPAWKAAHLEVMDALRQG
jgi:ABC-type antimicrobial peptide transport system permease subunit